MDIVFILNLYFAFFLLLCKKIYKFFQAIETSWVQVSDLPCWLPGAVRNSWKNIVINIWKWQVTLQIKQSIIFKNLCIC